jgi:hypothetical protein
LDTANVRRCERFYFHRYPRFAIANKDNAMPKARLPLLACTIVLPALVVLGAFAGCAGDDTVNPVPLPDAGALDASKDATADGSSHEASVGEAGPEAATSDASTPDAAEASAPDASDASSDVSLDAGPDAAADAGDF